MKKKNKQSFSSKVKLALMTLVVSVSLVIPTKPALAGQPVIDVAAIANAIIQFVQENAADAVREAALDAAAVFWNNGVQTFINQLVRETAIWVASGDEGQKPLLFTNDWGSYLSLAVADATAATAIAFADSAGLGNICVSPQVAIEIIIPQLDINVGRGPRCSLDDLRNSWDVTDPKFLENFTLSFRTNQNDLGIAVNFLGTLEQQKAKEKEKAKEERRKSVFKTVKDGISEFTKTPAPLVEQKVLESGPLAGTTTLEFTGRPVADAVRIFTATLAGQYLQQLKSGFFSLADVFETDARLRALQTLDSELITSPPGGASAEATFADLLTPDIIQVNSFDVVSELSICPTEVKYAGLYNCTIDSGFVQALQGGVNGYYTVQEAVNEGLLHGDWVFGYSEPGAGIEPSYLNGYAFSNMKKMRQLRIIPVGWEMAATRARQLGLTVTLQDVLDAYEGPDGVASPFYHLVDPQWVLRVPEIRCGAQVPGQLFLVGSSDRLSTCVDIQDCVAFGADGACLSWGYCTHDKKTWDFPGQRCDEVFATCDQYFERGQGQSDNYWLGDTLTYEGCNADTAGCTWYSVAQNSVGEWDSSNRVYLSDKAQVCDEDAAGCREYIRMGNGSNLLRNSSFEDDGGHNYQLGQGDQQQDNSIPDGWSPRQASVSLDDTDSQSGVNSVVLSAVSGGNCLPGLQYQAPIGSFEVAQPYTLSGFVRTDNPAPRPLQLAFQNLNFTIEQATSEWQSFAFTFTMPATSSEYTMVLGANGGDCSDLNIGGQVFYDSLQLERGTASTNYKDYGSENIVYLQNAPACTFEEVGCLEYEPVNDNLGSNVTGIVTGADLCPEECNEYFTYEQKETNTEPTRFVNFIADSAAKCSAEAVGCEEYTNLDTVAEGGEGREYYTSIRHCERPSGDCATFFTWEGSDTTGFQLMNFSLYTDGGVPRTVDGSTDCDPQNANCRELIAEDGTRYLRDITKTITCSNQCKPLRSRAGLVNQQECEDKLGSWDALSERCIFQAILEESITCGQQELGCREYVGNTGYNVEVVYSDDFEGQALDGWVSGVLSTESTEVGGHSLRLGQEAGSINELAYRELPRFENGKNYTISFIAKSTVSDFIDVNVYLGDLFTQETRAGGFVTRNRNWNEYTVGPIQLADDAIVPALAFEVIGTTAQQDRVSLFFDNIVIREIQDSIYAIKDSWETPASCDTNPPLENGSASRSMVGCQEYRIENAPGADSLFIKSFTRLCSEDKVGCEALIDTHNSSTPYREIFQEGDEAEFIVPSDNVTFLVNNDEYECRASEKSCMELGKPTFDQDNNILEFESVFLKNDPDLYDTILCPGGALSCKEYQKSDASIVYAKDPGLQQCEYREVPNSFPVRFAWFKLDDDEENPDECINSDENLFVQRCNNSQISCTEYFEPITEEPFYYKKNTLRSEVDSCNGVMDWSKGCVLFNDLSQRDLLFKSGEDENFIGAPQGCQNNDQGCNTNTLLRVSLNRECSQWITGNSLSRFWDEDQQTFKTTSYGLGRCLEADPANPQICRKWDNDPTKDALTIAEYQARETEWNSDEHTGYSIPGLYPVETLRQRSVGFDEDGNPKNFRLTRLSNPTSTCVNTTDCAVGQVCRLDLDPDTGAFEGRCYVEQGVDSEGTVEAAQCRGYPEINSPFPSSLATFAPDDDEDNPGLILSKKQQFVNANIGQEDEIVECSYHKVRYGGEVLYYNLDTIPPSAILSEGNVTPFTTQDTFIGWEGYCLERDTSRVINGSDDQFACLTWYPVDLIQGTFDVNNSDIKAGYLVGQGAQYYCAEAIVAEWRTTYQFCARASCGSGYTTTRGGSCAGRSHNRRECNPIGGDGWYPYDGDIKGNEQLGIMCNKVARIADARGRTAAWTTRILGDILPGSQEYFVEGVGWGFDQINKPYGSARPVATRLEDLSQPLVALDPNTFIDNCEKCEQIELGLSGYKVSQRSFGPFGACADEEPDRQGRLCNLRPNAGSPFALYSPVDPSLINDDIVPIRRENRLKEEEPQPYPGSEDYTVGFTRLQQLFAKSYGIWEWQSLPNICVGECNGGIADGEFCSSDASCGQPEPELTYACVPDVCVGGFRNGQSCTEDSECEFTSTGTIHQCVEEQGPESDGDFICESGPFIGQPCSSIDDCEEDNANGICGTSANFCQATDADGNVVNGENSGRACNSATECSSTGTCVVERCSSDPEGTDSGLCSGKSAGDSCGVSSITNRYARLPVGNPAVGWDLVQSNPGAAQPPIVRPVVSDPSRSTGFTEGFNTAVTINGSTSGDIQAQDGRAPVNVSFYAYNENGEQMPLRLILIDWGDGTDPAESRGSFKNHKHECRNFCSNAVGISCTLDEDCQDISDPDAQCLPFNFGDSSDACIDDGGGANGFFSFTHTYTCEGPAPCSYTPQVLVRDNWGATTRVSYNGQIIVDPPLNPDIP